MNKTAIKNFAVWARNKLISEVKYKAGLLGITDKGIAEPLPQSTDDLQFFDIGTKQPAQLKGKTAIEQRRSLVATIKSKSLKYCDAYEAVIEEVAYTWFNRLIAIRFMEVNDYLPSRVRVLSSENPAKAEPDFVTNPFDTDLDFSDTELDLIDNLKDLNKSEELFQFLFIKQCNKLNEILPVLFEKTDDYTELLLNVSFTDKDGVVWHLVHDIPEEYFYIGEDGYGQVEIIGWLYQYYNTEPKDKVFARPSGQKIRKEDVPAATQLFTPDWIVRYMVENSLGRIVINNLTYDVWAEEETKKIDVFKKKWRYYLDDAKQTPEVDTQLRMMEHNKYAKGDVPPFVGTKFLDPCMGSGHILVYSFDVFMDIYRAQGYTDRDAAQNIVKNNIYGLELDDRAAQLAYFAIMMKARSYDRRFLTRGIKPNVCAIQESNNLNYDYLKLFGDLEDTAVKLCDEFKDAKEYGSIINLKISPDEIAQLEEKYRGIIETHYDNMFDLARQAGLRTLFAPLLKQAKIMVQKYDVVCTNPPYMGGSGMSAKLSEFVKKNYPDSKADLFACFIEKGNNWVVKDGYNSMVTMQSWMFLSSFEKMRMNILATRTIVDLMHMENMVMGIAFGTAVTIFKNCRIPSYKGTYIQIKLQDIIKDEDTGNSRPKVFPNRNNRYSEVSTDNFSKIPGSPVAYWVSESVYNAYNYETLGEHCPVKKGHDTGNNDLFLRYWYEIDTAKFACLTNDRKWQIYIKGGEFRKYYGHLNYVVNWENDGFVIKSAHNSTIRNAGFNYLKCITWSDITSSTISARFVPSGCLRDSRGPAIFPQDDELYYILGFMCTKVVLLFQSIVNPTICFQIGSCKSIPIIVDNEKKDKVNVIVEENVELSKSDWDSFETSWDFKKHPFLAQSLKLKAQSGESATLISECYKEWEQECEQRFNQLKANEEELNRIFIEIYGLQDELTPEVEDKDVTVRKADLKRDVRSFISYAVGCMFGRYSIYVDGLMYAGEKYTLEDFVNRLNAREGTISFEELNRACHNEGVIWSEMVFPDEDNCILITDTNYYNDDIVNRFVYFLSIVFGENTLEENLDFIANALGNKGNTSREVIRNYFLNDFFKDHSKIYQKRPIYWLFDSGKQNGFKALVYMHRWNADTIGNVRVEYLHRIQRVYEREIEREQDTIDNSNNSRDKAAAAKRKEKLLKQLKETKEYDAMIAHLALSRIDIDLDDGVKVNYEKVQTGQDGKKLPVLGKI